MLRKANVNRLGQAARPARRRGDREQEVVELNAKVPVPDQRNKNKKVYRWLRDALSNAAKGKKLNEVRLKTGAIPNPRR